MCTPNEVDVRGGPAILRCCPIFLAGFVDPSKVKPGNQDCRCGLVDEQGQTVDQGCRKRRSWYPTGWKAAINLY